MQALVKSSILIVAAGVVAWALQYPVNSGLTRVALLLAFALLLISALSLVWKQRWIRVGGLVGLLAFLVFLLMPVRPYAEERLAGRYIGALHDYKNVPYVWGGEGRNGMDCSGLPRRAMRDALVEEGFVSLNGGLVRAAALQWWFDASARALAEGYRNYLLPLEIEGTIREMDYGDLRPGDIAITKSGVHCLVYLEEELWIQADPHDAIVGVYNGRTSNNGWLDAPVAIYRWSNLQ